jgi:hypothetical protein
MDRDNKSEIKNSEEWTFNIEETSGSTLSGLATEGRVFRIPSDKRRKI